jgi:hypothetical protein
MEIFKIAAKINKPLEEVFHYVTTPQNFPRWKKDVWISGKQFGQMGAGCRMVQTVYLLSPRKFTMHVTGYEQNRYFKFEALKGYVLLPGWSFFFELYEGVTLLTVTCEMNACGPEVKGLVYPSGLYWHWNTFFTLLSKELSLDHKKDMEIIAFMELADSDLINRGNESRN